jgi:hypothetical protein
MKLKDFKMISKLTYAFAFAVIVLQALTGSLAAQSDERPAVGPTIDRPSQSQGQIIIPKSSTKDSNGKVRARTNSRYFVPDAEVHIPSSPFEQKDGK